MSDSTPIVSGASREAVAYALLMGIAQSQGKAYMTGNTPIANADLKWVEEHYLKCWRIAGGERSA